MRVARKILKGEKATSSNLVAGGAAVARRYDAQGHPASGIVDEAGAIRSRRRFLTPVAFESFVQRFLAEAAAGTAPAE